MSVIEVELWFLKLQKAYCFGEAFSKNVDTCTRTHTLESSGISAWYCVLGPVPVGASDTLSSAPQPGFVKLNHVTA